MTHGQRISKKCGGWGKGIVEELANYIVVQGSGIQGFSARNLWRMKQFYETYQGNEKLSAVLTEISWSNHLHILSKTKSMEEKEYYFHCAIKNAYSERAFARLIDTVSYERTLLADAKSPLILKDFPEDTLGIFKDSYVFEFLGLLNTRQN